MEWLTHGKHLLFGQSGTTFEYRTADSLAKDIEAADKRMYWPDDQKQIIKRRRKFGRLDGRLRKRRYSSGSKLGYSTSELKFADSEVSVLAIAATWGALNPTTLDCLNAVVQGPGESEHLGRTMYMTSIHIKGFFKKVKQETGADPTADIILRLALVLDTDTKGAEVTASDVMDTGGSSDIFAFRNLQHTSRLKVLKDFTVVMRQTNMNEGAINVFAHGERRMKFKMHYRFKKPIRVLFSGTTAVVASIVDNSLHVVGIASLTGVTVTYQCRLRFKDNL